MTRPILLALLTLAPSAHAQFGLPRLPNPPVESLPPNLPLLEPDPSFPLRFHIVTERWGGKGYRNHGYGSANLTDPAAPKSAPRGFDFAFECDVPFAANDDPSVSYQARWKKQPHELEILTVQPGSNQVQTCKLALAPELHPFDPANTIRYTHGVSSSLRVRWSNPDFAYEFANPDYPVQFHVLEGQRREGSATDQGWGTANLADPSTQTPLQGADYQYDCDHGFLNNSQRDNYYQGRWIKPDQKLELLLQRAGSDKVDRCTVSVAIHAQSYPERRPAQPPLPTSTGATLIRPASSAP
jgi:hypothetical protein